MNGHTVKASISIRVPMQRWFEQALFDEMLVLLEENPRMVDELALFTSFTHAPLPLATIREQVPVLKDRISTAKEHGFQCGINILATMGHHNENLAYSLQGNYTRRTDLDGKICDGSFCPNDTRFICDYVIPLYELMTSAHPDFIWIDDDVRSGHMGIGPDCFCQCCLDHFTDVFGFCPTREDMARYLNCGTPENLILHRKLWLQSKCDTINRLFVVIENTVHQINPAIDLGFMTGERFADGYDFVSQANILSGQLTGAVRWRPGGGFYRDTVPGQLVEKAHQIGRQVALLPRHVSVIQSEVENFNYEPLGKSITINTSEAATYIAAGCTGAALNIVNIYEDIRAEKGKLFRAFAQQRAFFDTLVEHQEQLPAQGIFTGWNKNSWATINLKDSWFDSCEILNPDYADQWFEIGLPVSYSPENAQVTMLNGNAPFAFSKPELLHFLKSGLFLDGQALDALNDLGFSELTGYRTDGCDSADCVEILTDDWLNGEHGGNMRDCRQSFWKYPCAKLLSTSLGTRSLARAVDYQCQTKADCCMGIYENLLGGRICISGYYPWSFILNHAKSEQYKRLARWLSKDTILAYIASFHKINIWVRKNDCGKIILYLLSQNLDVAESPVVRVLTGMSRLRVINSKLEETVIRAASKNKETKDGYQEFILPNLEPWRLVMAYTE